LHYHDYRHTDIFISHLRTSTSSFYFLIRSLEFYKRESVPSPLSYHVFLLTTQRINDILFQCIHIFTKSKSQIALDTIPFTDLHNNLSFNNPVRRQTVIKIIKCGRGTNDQKKSLSGVYTFAE